MARTNDLIHDDECDLKWEALLFGKDGSLATLNNATIKTGAVIGKARVIGKHYSYPLASDPLVNPTQTVEVNHEICS